MIKFIGKFLFFSFLFGVIIETVSKIKDTEIPVSEKITSFIPLVVMIGIICLIYLYNRHKKNQERIYQDKLQKKREEYIQKVYEYVENDLQAIQTNINLTKDDQFFFKLDNVNWQEMRKDRTSISYAGLSQTITIAKGLRFKIGNIAPIQHTKDTLKTIESGVLYLTNKNILLISEYASKKIDLNKIVQTNVYSDAISIQRQSGKAVFLPMNFENIINFSIILEKFLA